MNDQVWLWIGFNLFVLAMLALDLGVFHRKTHVVTLRKSVTWTIIWVALVVRPRTSVLSYAGITRDFPRGKV